MPAIPEPTTIAFGFNELINYCELPLKQANLAIVYRWLIGGQQPNIVSAFWLIPMKISIRKIVIAVNKL